MRRALLRNASICYRAKSALTPMLDATPAGREVYLPLGFSDGEPIERWRGNGAGGGGQPVAEPSTVRGFVRSMRSAFGADRLGYFSPTWLRRPGAVTASTRDWQRCLRTRAAGRRRRSARCGCDRR